MRSHKSDETEDSLVDLHFDTILSLRLQVEDLIKVLGSLTKVRLGGQWLWFELA